MTIHIILDIILQTAVIYFKAESCYILVDNASSLLTYPIFCSLVYHRYLIILQQYKQFGYRVYTVVRECMKILVMYAFYKNIKVGLTFLAHPVYMQKFKRIFVAKL